MELTLVNLNETKDPQSKIKAFLDVKLESLGIILKDIKIIYGKAGFFVGLPAKKANDQWVDLIAFDNAEVAQDFKASVLMLYETEAQKHVILPYQNSQELVASPPSPEVDWETPW